MMRFTYTIIFIVILFCFCNKNNNDVPVSPEEVKYGAIQGTLNYKGEWDRAGFRTVFIKIEVGGREELISRSDSKDWIGTTPGEEYWQVRWKIGDEKQASDLFGLKPGIVVVKVFHEYQELIGNSYYDRSKSLAEVTTIGGSPIEIRPGQVTQIGTIEVILWK